MGVLDRIRGRNDARTAHIASNNGSFTHDQDERQENEKQQSHDHVDTDDSSSVLSISAYDAKKNATNPHVVTADAQDGVKKAEAAALVWSKGAVYTIYGWIWLCFFMLAFQSAIGVFALYNAYSTFSAAPEVATALILAAIVGGVIKLPVAKILNIWGRAEGLLFSLVIYIVGIIIIAACEGPKSYAAGYTIYWIGYDALYIILDVFVADTSGLRNRAFAWAFAQTPFIATAFLGPLAGQSILNMTSWRWAYGIFAIVQVFVFVPLAIAFKFYQRKAKRLGVLQRAPSGRSMGASMVHYFHKFDVIGAIILIAAFVLFLLPFSMATNINTAYTSATFIVQVVIGTLLFPCFYVWERFFARDHFVNWQLFRSRTVLGASVLAATLFFSFYCWDIYFLPYLSVVYNLPYAQAGYMLQIYNVGSCFWAVIFGIWVRYKKTFKWSCLFFGLPLMILGAALLTHFRGSDSPIGYLVMSQIFIAFAGGTLVIGENMAVMAAADREGVPMMLSLLSLFSSLGGAIGLTVSSAIYNAIFPSRLASRLPEAQRFNASAITSAGYTAQILYPVGGETRDAIDYAWAEAQRYEAIAATVILVLGVPAILVWKNYRVDRQQNKGTVI